jgi:hypothetical protein
MINFSFALESNQMIKLKRSLIFQTSKISSEKTASHAFTVSAKLVPFKKASLIVVLPFYQQ